MNTANAASIARKIIFRGLLAALMVSAAIAHAVVVLPISVTDDRGVRVSFAEAPARIVSLLPSLTESVCVLGACKKLVGVDRYSNWPEAVQRLPKLGGGLDPNLERVLRMRPDVVLIATSSPLIARLETMGLKVLAMEPKTVAEVGDSLRRIAELLDVDARDRARQVWAQINDRVAAIARALPERARGRRVYFEVGDATYAASESSFVGELLTRLGEKNIVPGRLGAFPKLSAEYVLRADPELIMLGERSVHALAARPGWAEGLQALKAGRLCQFSRQESDVLVRAGPRLDEAASLMARCLQTVFAK